MNTFLFYANLKDLKTVNIFLTISFQIRTKFYLSRYEFQTPVVIAVVLYYFVYSIFLICYNNFIQRQWTKVKLSKLESKEMTVSLS